MRKSFASLAVSAVLLAACADVPAPVNPRDAVLNAMRAVYEMETLHQELEMSMSAAGEDLSFSGESDVDNVRKRIDMTMDMGMLGGEMQILMDGGVIYMRWPVFEDVGTEWVSMDPSKMDPAAAAQFGGFGMGTTDPSAYVGLFAGVFDVKASGEQELDGVSTTHYVGSIDLAKVLEGFSDVVGEDVDAVTKKQLEMAVEQFSLLGIDKKIPFEIWIDEDGLPRRQRITMDFGDLVPGTEEASMEMTVDFSDFGQPVDIEIPRPSEVTDMTETLAEAGNASGSSGAYG
ncbi:MAG TPA: hypothetical protein VMR89_10655 [Actinomycetota bacterium]|nr:hypothetical protein [Actinomycetota bacterium]